jgi:hypothetical protein
MSAITISYIDVSVNVPPLSGPYSGVFYTITAAGGFNIQQQFDTIFLAPQNPINRFDVTNALQVKYDVREFNKKIGLNKDSNNRFIIDTSLNGYLNRYPTDSIIITASEFVSHMSAPQIISVGTYSTLYSDFISYVNSYFSMAGGFSSLFSSVNNFEYNNGIFDANAFINIINEKTIDASGAYVSQLTGSITIYNINNLLQYAIEANVFANRNHISGTTSADPNNPANYGMRDGFMAGDLILVPAGTRITLNLIIDPGSANITVSGLNQISSSKIKYGSSNYTESTTAVMTNINRVLTAPLLIKLENLS